MKATSLRVSLLSSILVLFPITATAQITIESSDVSTAYAPGRVYENREDTSGSAVNIGIASSSAQNWNFVIGRTYNVLLRQSYLNPATTPYIGRFPSSNIVSYAKDSSALGKIEIWVYDQITTSEYLGLGTAVLITVSGQEDLNVDSLRPPRPYAKLPLQYGTNWIHQSQPEVKDRGGGITTREVIRIQNTVDAFGSVTVPGKTFNALRLKYVEIDSGQTFQGGNLIRTSVDTLISYTWIGEDGSTVQVAVDPSQPSSGSIKPISVGYSLALVTSVELVDSEIPDHFSLAQNYPNPFNPSTEIEFEIEPGGQTTLRVYNLLGEQVATLLDRSLPAGYYRIKFEARNLSSGVYIYALESVGRRITKRMILMK